jgi:hypothetical protein
VPPASGKRARPTARVWARGYRGCRAAKQNPCGHVSIVCAASHRGALPYNVATCCDMLRHDATRNTEPSEYGGDGVTLIESCRNAVPILNCHRPSALAEVKATVLGECTRTQANASERKRAGCDRRTGAPRAARDRRAPVCSPAAWQRPARPAESRCRCGRGGAGPVPARMWQRCRGAATVRHTAQGFRWIVRARWSCCAWIRLLSIGCAAQAAAHTASMDEPVSNCMMNFCRGVPEPVCVRVRACVRACVCVRVRACE